MSIRPITLIEEAQSARRFPSFSDPVPGKARHSAGVERHLRDLRPLSDQISNALAVANVHVAKLADGQAATDGDQGIKAAFAGLTHSLFMWLEHCVVATNADAYTAKDADASDIEDVRLALLSTFDAIREGRAS